MEGLKPVLVVAALVGAVVGEGWLRAKAHRFDEDYVGVLDLVSDVAARAARVVPARGRATSLRPSPKPFFRSYRASPLWSSGSDVPTPEGQLGA